MSYKEKLGAIVGTITFADVEPVEDLGRVITHKFGDRVFGISRRRLDQSDCADATTLHVSDDGKWLIPADTVRGDIEVSW